MIRGDWATSDLSRADMGEFDMRQAGIGADDWLTRGTIGSARYDADDEAVSGAEDGVRGEMGRKESESGEEAAED